MNCKKYEVWRASSRADSARQKSSIELFKVSSVTILRDCDRNHSHSLTNSKFFQIAGLVLPPETRCDHCFYSEVRFFAIVPIILTNFSWSYPKNVLDVPTLSVPVCETECQFQALKNTL